MALAAGKLVPALTDGPELPFVLLGAGFGVVGVALVVLAHVRRSAVDAALVRGEYAPFDDRLALALTAAGAALGVVTVALLLLA